MKDAWAVNRKQIETLRSTPDEDGDHHPLNFLVPVEVLVPSNLENDEVVDEFNGSLLDIYAARNNNHELTDETKSNKKGYYEELRRALPERIAGNVEWKTNDGGLVKVRDIVALALRGMAGLDRGELTPHPGRLLRGHPSLTVQIDSVLGQNLPPRNDA